MNYLPIPLVVYQINSACYLFLSFSVHINFHPLTIHMTLITTCHSLPLLSSLHSQYTHDTHPHTHITVPSAPINVRFFCPMLVWGLPANPNGQIESYHIEIIGSISGILSETASENFFSISDPQGVLRGSIKIRVSSSLYFVINESDMFIHT